MSVKHEGVRSYRKAMKLRAKRDAVEKLRLMRESYALGYAPAGDKLLA